MKAVPAGVRLASSMLSITMPQKLLFFFVRVCDVLSASYWLFYVPKAGEFTIKAPLLIALLGAST